MPPPPVRTPTSAPRILLYALGNYTHPGTRHSLGQFVLGGLAKELGLPSIQRGHAGTSKSNMGDGRMEEKKVNGWVGWIGAGWVDLGVVKRDIFGRAIVKHSVISGVDQSGPAPLDRVHVTIATPREPMNLSGRNLTNLIRTLSTTPSPPLPPATPIVLVLHDSLEIPSATFKPPSLKATTEGHNGLRSIVTCPLTSPPSHLGSGPTASSGRLAGKFWRIPLGIGRPGDGTRFSSSGGGGKTKGDGQDIARWVLGKMDGEERLFWEGEGARALAEELKRWARGL